MSDSNFTDYEPKRFGLIYDPPMIILEYSRTSTGKSYHHKIRLRRLTGISDPQAILEYIKATHSIYINHPYINETHLTTLISRLQKSMRTAKPEVDLNKLTPEEVQEYKNKMDEEFFKHQVNPGDEEYVYDSRKEFVPTQASPWDESDEEIF